MKISKVDAVVTTLNCALEACFTKEEVEEYYGGDVVGNHGYYFFKDTDKKFMEAVDGERFDVDKYYTKLFIKKISPLKILQELGWEHDISLEYAEPMWNEVLSKSDFLKELMKEGK